MRAIRHLLACLAAICCTAAVVGSRDVGLSEAFSEDDSQIRLELDMHSRRRHGDTWTVREQDGRVCEAASGQLTGRVNVTDEKSMFFWFFESPEEAQDKPVVIWLNGGPGASSMMGLFGAVGPCLLHVNSSSTYRNVHSWNQHANMLFIDQPAGVGLSTITDKSQYPTELGESSADFSALVDTIFDEILPSFASNPLILAGESFGGAYVPRYAHDIEQRRANRRRGRGPDVSVSGVILLNAVVSDTYIATGHYDMFCVDGVSSPLRFNDTACAAMAAAIPECERLHHLCEVTGQGETCLAAVVYCSNNVYAYFNEEVESHRHSPYDVTQPCPHPPVCDAGDKGLTGSPTKYLQRGDVQSLLGFDVPIDYEAINFELNTLWSSNPAIYAPRTPELGSLMDGNVPVLVINGNLDVSVNTPGTVRTYDNLAWKGQAGFRLRQLQPWVWEDGTGVESVGGGYKGVPGLDLYTVDDAGHMAAADQREAVADVFKRWLVGLTDTL